MIDKLNLVQYNIAEQGSGGEFVQDSEKSKEHIIEVTTQLIEECEGEAEQITSRMIAQKAGIGLGLINYHFGSKEKLITTCVQRIIGRVITEINFSKEYATDKERLTAWATTVFDFLFEHRAISRISILGDFHDYSDESNSVRTQHGFMLALKNEIKIEYKTILVFTLTSAMQAAFLGNGTVSTILGFDLSQEAGRHGYIKKLVDLLFEENRREDEIESKNRNVRLGSKSAGSGTVRDINAYRKQF